MNMVFASQNKNKIREIAGLLPTEIALAGLDEFSLVNELEEPFDKLELNAIHKARTVFQLTGLPSFADDTGLEVDALGGRPGVYSARYASEAKDPQQNMNKLLAELDGITNRKAQFRTVIAWTDGKTEKLFEGIVRGEILSQKRGEKGFGYDPVFQPEGCDRSFAEMDLSEKNTISHRARAFAGLTSWLGENFRK
jgi:XTP/dITP diphosphohydrolase